MSQPQQATPQFVYVDIPEIPESFADSLEKMSFDGMTFKFEFVVNRLDPVSPPKPPTGHKYPSCRLVMPMAGALSLYAQLEQLMKLLEQQGVIKKGVPQQPPPAPVTIQ
jgi:hypothetical protein